MQKSLFLPILVLTAGAAFALGWIVRPSDSGDTKETAAKQTSKSRTSHSGRPTGRSYRGPGSSESPQVAEFLARYRTNEEISPEDMAAAIKEMQKENDPLLRRKLFLALLEGLTPENAKEAYLAMLSGRRGGFGRGGGGEDELRLLAHAWGRLDGPGAVKALKEIQEERGDGGGRGGRGWDRGGAELVSVLSGWAAVDGTGAVNYLNGIEDEREQRMAAFGVIRGMMVNGVDEAMGFVSSMPATEENARTRSFYTSMIASEMLEDGIDSAKAWVDTINDPDLRGGALSRVAESAMREDLESAVEWVTQYADDESAGRAISRIANEWAEDDPQAVLKWADSLPDSARAEAYGEAFGEWTREDATAAGEYLTNMPSSPARDSAVEEFATTLAYQEPATAMQWAESISDPDTRTEAITEVAQTWMRTDRTAANEWLEASNLPAETVQAINEVPQRSAFDFRRGGGGPGGGRGRGR